MHSYVRYTNIQKSALFIDMAQCLIICGITASSKSMLAEKLSQYLEVDIINADSQQVYKNLPIITSQPQNKLNHYLYGFLDIDDQYNSFQWSKDASECIQNSILKGRLPVLVGGSGFYIRNLLTGHIKNNNLSTKHDFCSDTIFKIVILMPPKEIIFQKTRSRILNIFLEACKEVKNVTSAKANKIIGVPQIKAYLNGIVSADECIDHIHRTTMQYAKRQRTWFTHQINGLILRDIDDDQNLEIILQNL